MQTSSDNTHTFVSTNTLIIKEQLYLRTLNMINDIIQQMKFSYVTKVCIDSNMIITEVIITLLWII